MMHLLHLENTPILEQLQMEEALLRADERSFCILNTGSPEAIVMGLSGNEEELLHLSKVREANVPIIKRFSGGGTVFIDPKTIFVTFIAESRELGIQPFPHAIMEWTKEFYAPFFKRDDFKLVENDYVFGERKFGGNAQYIKKERFLHHTSFLWEVDFNKMEYLKLPKKRPTYRQSRSHKDFLSQLSDYFPKKEKLIEDFKKHLKGLFQIEEVTKEDLQEIFERPYRKSTVVI